MAPKRCGIPIYNGDMVELMLNVQQSYRLRLGPVQGLCDSELLGEDIERLVESRNDEILTFNCLPSNTSRFCRRSIFRFLDVLPGTTEELHCRLHVHDITETSTHTGLSDTRALGTDARSFPCGMQQREHARERN